MKKFACLFMVLVCAFSGMVFAEDTECTHPVLHQYDANDYTYVIPIVIGTFLGHTRSHTRYIYCADCGLVLSSEVIEEPELHSFNFARYTNVVAGHDSNYHWETGDEVLRCVCGKTKTGETSVRYLYEAHYTNNSTDWIDAGHYGNVHYYDQICSHSTCGVQYRWRTIQCPGGAHIGPASVIITPPVVDE